MAFLAFLKPILNIRGLMITGAVLLALFLGVKIWGFVDQALEDRQTVLQQQLTIELKESEIETLHFQMDQAEEAQRIAEAAQRAAEEREGELRQIRDAALASGDERDGEIAPVLGDTLRALRERMQ